jgi:hypothetical protein
MKCTLTAPVYTVTVDRGMERAEGWLQAGTEIEYKGGKLLPGQMEVTVRATFGQSSHERGFVADFERAGVRFAADYLSE